MSLLATSLLEASVHSDRAEVRGEVVVGYDGSASGTSAVKYAAGEALRTGRPLLVLTVDPGTKRGRRRRSGPDRMAEEMAPCRLIASTRLHYPDLVVRSKRVDGDAVEGLLDRSPGDALLVVGSRGLDQAGRLVLGSTSVAVAGRSRIPVVIVPSGWPGWQPRSHHLEPVVVGIDPSHDGEELVAFALSQAGSRGVGLITVTAVPPEPGIERSIGVRQRLASTELDELVRATGPDHPQVPVEAHQFRGYPVPALLQSSLGAPLLIVGRHHSGRFGFRIGSVTREVLHRAEIPVAVVPLT
jgi:nucleotide-binding universal stress UspA family protein